MSRLDPMHLVAHGRLATGVKKAHLYAGLNDEGEVVYLTLEWAGM